jgi:hypothetical protein
MRKGKLKPRSDATIAFQFFWKDTAGSPPGRRR